MTAGAGPPSRTQVFLLCVASPLRSLHLCVHSISGTEREDTEIAEKSVHSTFGGLGVLAFILSFRNEDFHPTPPLHADRVLAPGTAASVLRYRCGGGWSRIAR